MISPLSTRPKITNQSIQNGFVMRYFTAYLADGKRARVYEIDALQYAKFKPDIRYITIQLPWIITGNDKDLLSTSGYMVPGAKTKNQKIVEYYKQQMPNLEKYLTNPLEYFSGTSIRIPEYIVPFNGTFVDVNSLANTGTVSGYNITASVAPEPDPEPEPGPPGPYDRSVVSTFISATQPITFWSDNYLASY